MTGTSRINDILTKIITMTWNKKNQQIEMLAGLRQSSVRIAQPILRRADKFKPTKVLVDLKQINKSIARYRGRPYDPKTLKEAIAQLDELTFGWFVITKTYNWHLHEVMVYPVEMVLQKLSENRDKTPKLNRGNPMYSEDHKKNQDEQQQQEISKLDSLLGKIGLKFTYDNLRRLWREADKSWNNVERAIKYMLKANGSQSKGVRNPHGFLVECLRWGWYIDPEPEMELPVFGSDPLLNRFVRDIFSFALSRDNPVCQT